MNADAVLRAAEYFGVERDGAVATELQGGYSNDVWRIDAGGQSFVLRRYGRLHVTRAALAFEHGVLEHVAARMPEVVAPLRDVDGATLRLLEGQYVAVLPYLAGTTGARDLSAGCEAARLLGRYHRAASDIHIAGGMRSTRSLGMLSWLRERFTHFAADEVLGRALPWNALIAATTASTARIAPLARELPHVVVHGDVNPGNVVQRAGRAAGLIDFDFARESERIYDVATLLDEFGRPDDDAALEIERLAPIVRAYAEEAPISDAERHVVPESMIRRAVTLVWYVVTRHGERARGEIGGAARYASRVSELATASEEIRAAI
ncbi:MAG: hypothetical protein NVSMB5_09020 [Candidatus Velthaea sp.]